MMIASNGLQKMTSDPRLNPFNSAIETGVRSLAILVASFPETCDLERLVEMDYLTVHTGDAPGGPESLHTPLPLRAGELLVRRGLIEKGLNLMMSRRLIVRIPSSEGFSFLAGETGGPFLKSLSTNYARQLIDRAEWTVSMFRGVSTQEIRRITHRLFERWSTQFQSIQNGAPQ
jgi:hypothetical protein